MKAILTYLPFLQEAWKSSGKKTYTWKSNRTSMCLLLGILLLLYGGYVGHGKYEKKIDSLQKEVKTLQTTKYENALIMKKGDMDVLHLKKTNLELSDTLKLQNTTLQELRTALINKDSDLKTTQLEKQNVEKLLVASANQTRVLTEKMAEVGNHSRRVDESKSEIRKNILALYGTLNQ